MKTGLTQAHFPDHLPGRPQPGLMEKLEDAGCARPIVGLVVPTPLTWPGFHFAATTEESKNINGSRFPSIIVSSNGMCMGGRIQHHLIQRLPDPRNLVLFIGYQAVGTRGRQIKEGAHEVKIFGEIVPVRAQVAVLEQFSDHADVDELLECCIRSRRFR